MSETVQTEIRSQIFHHIQMNPGLHFRELCRQLHIGIGLLDHHANVLQKQGLLTTFRIGNHKCFFTSDVPPCDRNYLILLRSKTVRTILLNLLKSHDGLTHNQLVHVTRLAPSTVSWHIQRLEKEGVAIRNQQHVTLADFAAIKNVLATYKETLIDSMTSKFLDMWT